MRLWAALYGMIWVVFVEFALGLVRPSAVWITYLHVALGLVIVAFAYSNLRELRSTRAPGRVKRIARASYQLSIVMVVLGVLVWAHLGSDWPIVGGETVWNFVVFLHLANALAIITQSAAIAIAYDMWEEKEFATETRPGEIPLSPRPGTEGASRP